MMHILPNPPNKQTKVFQEMRDNIKRGQGYVNSSFRCVIQNMAFFYPPSPELKTFETVSSQFNPPNSVVHKLNAPGNQLKTVLTLISLNCKNQSNQFLSPFWIINFNITFWQLPSLLQLASHHCCSCGWQES